MIKQLFIFFFVVPVLCALLATGCLGDNEQFPFSSSDTYEALLVPDTNLDLYLYAKQDRPTIVPSKIVNLSHDIKVDSLAIWGVPSEESIIFGAGLTFASAADAAEIYSNIKSDNDIWKIIRDNKIYIVRGTGDASESLKTAILDNNFKYYTDGDVLRAVAMLPRSGRTKMVAIAVAKPSEQVLEFTAGYIGMKNMEYVNNVFRFLNPELIVGGLYSPHLINVAKAVEWFEKGNDIEALDVGVLILVKSNLPGFVVTPGVKNILKDYGFEEEVVGETTLYKSLWSASDKTPIPIFVRVEGNDIFAAVSGQEDYAQTLIMSVYK